MTCAAVKFGIQKPKVLAFPHTGCLSNPQVPKTEILFYCMHFRDNYLKKYVKC